MLLLFPLQRLKFSKRKGTRTRQNESKKQRRPSCSRCSCNQSASERE